MRHLRLNYHRNKVVFFRQSNLSIKTDVAMVASLQSNFELQLPIVKNLIIIITEGSIY